MSGYELEDMIVGTQTNPVARTTDPHTSHDAADSIPSENIRKRQKAVLMILEALGPLTDEQIAAHYATAASAAGTSHFPPQSPSGLRTRRSELHHAGYVVDTGERRRLKSGRMAIVWAAPKVRQPVDLFPSVPAAEHNQLTL